MRARRGRRERHNGKPQEPYGEGSRERSEHRVLKVGHIFDPEYRRKLIRMITCGFR